LISEDIELNARPCGTETSDGGRRVAPVVGAILIPVGEVASVY
jgi:hypothetical protein